MENCTVILAAGEGKRMGAQGPKVLCRVLSKPILEWVLDAVRGAGISDVCVVTGHKRQEVEGFIKGLCLSPAPETVLQAQRRGTGHAVMMAGDFLRRHSGGSVLILCGDAPFITPELIKASLETHEATGSSVTVLTAVAEEPRGYGRVVRKNGELAAIVEHKDADPETLLIKEINSGSYWFRTDDLLQVLSLIRNDNAQGEYYLPDAVRLLLAQGKKAAAFTAPERAVLGANDKEQLELLNSIALEGVNIRRRGK